MHIHAFIFLKKIIMCFLKISLIDFFTNNKFTTIGKINE
jgi:hypothetical protein